MDDGFCPRRLNGLYAHLSLAPHSDNYTSHMLWAGNNASLSHSTIEPESVSKFKKSTDTFVAKSRKKDQLLPK